MYVKCDIEQRYCNYCCFGKAIRITNAKCVFVDIGIQDSIHMRHVVICGLSDSTIFLYIVSNGTIFGEKMLLNTKCVI